jgi:hypothetical protein
VHCSKTGLRQRSLGWRVGGGEIKGPNRGAVPHAPAIRHDASLRNRSPQLLANGLQADGGVVGGGEGLRDGVTLQVGLHNGAHHHPLHAVEGDVDGALGWRLGGVPQARHGRKDVRVVEHDCGREDGTWVEAGVGLGSKRGASVWFGSRMQCTVCGLGIERGVSVRFGDRTRCECAVWEQDAVQCVWFGDRTRCECVVWGQNAV